MVFLGIPLLVLTILYAILNDKQVVDNVFTYVFYTFAYFIII